MPQGIYLPEALLDDTVISIEEACRRDRILRGRAVVCTADHDLEIEYGSKRYRMDREETAIGIRERTEKEIAVLSRVGKPICFRVLDNTAFEPLISRRQVQEEVRAYYMNGGLQPGDVIQTVVTHLEPFGVFVDIGCGITSLIGIENISVSRIRHPGERFAVHQRIPAVVTGIDRARGHVLLSHRELLGTWEENADHFLPGETVEGIVRTVESYGIFVELTPNLSGLAEYRPGLEPGDSVAVYVKSLNPEKMKVKLMIIDKLPDGGPKRITWEDYSITDGTLDRWQYSPECCHCKRICTEF